MTTSIDVSTVINDMKSAVTQILGKDVTTLEGFSERQLKAIAQQAKLVSLGIASGEITEETRDYFLKSLKDMAKNFAETLRGLVVVTIEKIWNAVVEVIWKAIGAATGVAIPGL